MNSVQKQIERHTSIVARQMIGALPLRTMETATLDDVQIILDGCDRETCTMIASALLALPADERRTRRFEDVFELVTRRIAALKPQYI